MILNCKVTSIAQLASYGYVTVTIPISGVSATVYVPCVLSETIAVGDTLLVDAAPAYQVQVLASGWGTAAAASVRSACTTYAPSRFVAPSMAIKAAITNNTQLAVAMGLSLKDATLLKADLVSVGCTTSKISVAEIVAYTAINKVSTAPKYLTNYVTTNYLLTNYYTDNQIDGYMEDLQGFVVENYAEKTSVPTKTSQLTNDSDFITATAVSSTYLTKTAAAYTYATRSDVEATYLKQTDAASTYLSKTDASTTYAAKASIPTKVSQLTNDSGYITSTALTPYLKSTDAASTYLAKTDAASTYLSKTDASTTYATKASIPTKVSQLTNDAGFITGTYIASNYYNMVQVDTKVSDVRDAIPTKVSQLENDAGYITEGGGFKDHVHQLIGDATIAKMALSEAQKAVMKAYNTGKVIGY